MRSFKFFFWTAISVLTILCLAMSGRGQAQSAAPVRVVAPVPVVHIESPLPISIPVSVAAPMRVSFKDDWDSEMPVKNEETIRKTFTLTASEGKRLLDVDNVTGSIEVTGTSSDQVQLVVNKTIRAESKERLEKAQKEVTLDISQETGLLKLYVNGPFRCNCNDGCWHSRGEDGYSVHMDFQLQVPHDLELNLKTVNGGHVTVKDVNGHYSVRNVNGGIEMQDMAGSGHVKTVNGGVKVTFRENPREDSDFSTINGNVDLYFARNLSADFRFKTMNGGVFSDFPMTTLPASESQGERRNGRFVFHADRYTGGRVGSGGPQIRAENLNGTIRVLERQ